MPSTPPTDAGTPSVHDEHGYPDDYDPRDDAPGEPEPDRDPEFEEFNSNSAAAEPDEAPPVIEGVVPLGHDRGVFYYLSRAAGQVFELSAGQHTKAGLMAMASVPHYWETKAEFMSPKSGVMWDVVANSLMCDCRAIGIYDPARVRGRGAWLDAGRSVLNLGNRLVVDGERSGMMLADSKHVYEAAQPMLKRTAPPLSNKQAVELVKICESLRWEKPVNGKLLAGFLAVAPVCGGLLWRPSIWITGATGSGKSYCQDNIIAPALQGIALQVQSKTSEAGIRQALGSDARPVLFDEAEAEDQQAAQRMQGVLDLVRQSSSDGGADIVKGSSDGKAKRYRIRSCFMFSSINANILHAADHGRISLLSLRPPASKPDDETFAALNKRVQETITADFAAGMIARSVRNLPLIRVNAERFAVAVSQHLGSRRTGDQIGTLLAGAFSLHNEREVAADEALAFVKAQDWSSITEDAPEKDEYRLLSRITQHRIRVHTGNGTHWEVNVGRVIQAAFGQDQFMAADIAHDDLNSMGIRCDRNRDGILVSNSHPALGKLLEGTPWASAWPKALARLPNAQKPASTIRFATGHTAKAVFVPLQTIEGDGS